MTKTINNRKKMTTQELEIVSGDTVLGLLFSRNAGRKTDL